MKAPMAMDVKRSISVICENLKCPICLDLMSMPVSTKCDHQFCRFCMMKLLDRNKKKEASCPVCKANITKRSLQESPGFQRLVEGLQHMIQAYEEDTGIDYLTGESRSLKDPGLQRAGFQEIKRNGKKASCCDGQGAVSPDSSQSEGPEETGKSLSSMEAKQAYAKLMGFEDSCTAISDKEGFESDLTDVPQTSKTDTDGRFMSSTNNIGEQYLSLEGTKPTKAGISRPRRKSSGKKNASYDSSYQHKEGPEEFHSKTDRQHSESKKKSSDSGKIIDKRCRNSLQKVSEWLLKISPMDVDEDDMEYQGYASDGGSSSSTVKENQDEEQHLSLRKDDRSKSLEEQVFGVVYRRDRRSVGNQLNRTLSPEDRGITGVPACDPTEEAQTENSASFSRTSSRLTPTGCLGQTEEEPVFVNRSDCSEVISEPINDQLEVDGVGKKVSQTEYISGGSNGKKTVQIESLEKKEDSPIFEMLYGRTTEQPVSNVGGTWNKVENFPKDEKDGSGNDKESGKLRKRKSECRKNRLTQMRIAKTAKPLDLVSVGMDHWDPVVKPKQGTSVVETEVQIESYPSSEGQKTPDTRVTRRSKRLQVFTEEVQGNRKKSRSTRSTKNVVFHTDNTHALEKAGCKETVMSSGCPMRKNAENKMVKNGCIVDVDMTDIEKIESSFKADIEIQCGQKEIPANERIFVSAVKSSKSPLESSQCEDDRPTSRPFEDGVKAPSAEKDRSVNKLRCKGIAVEMEEDEKDDSEQDTEQLLKTFKTTKRKSFHLGIPSPTTSDRDLPDRGEQNQEGAEEQGPVNQEIIPDKDPELSCLAETMKQTEMQQKQETWSVGKQNPSIHRQTELENSCSSDIIPPSDLSSHAFHKLLLLKKKDIPTRTASDEGFEKCSNMDDEKSHATCAAKKSGIEGYAIVLDVSPSLGRKKKNLDTSSRTSVNAQTVDSALLLPVCNASEVEPQDTINAKSQENLYLGKSESQVPLKTTTTDLKNSGVLKPQTIGSVCPVRGGFMDTIHGSLGHHGTQTGNLENSGINKALESSLTPDGLLPPSVVVTACMEPIVSTGAKQRPGSFKATPEWSGEDSIALRKRKRPQRLESSGSEGSDEEDQFPSFAQLFGQNQSHSPAVQEPVLLNGEDQGISEEFIEGTPVLFKDTAGNASAAVPIPECGASSQGSVDLFDTPEECEGIPGERGLSVESSQFSNEVIATQQKVAMQEELRRLEKMMALVSEALHKKGDSPQAQVTGGQVSPLNPSSVVQRVGLDLHQNLPNTDQTASGPSRSKPSPPSALSPVSSPVARTLRHKRDSISPLPTPGVTAGQSPAQPSSHEDEQKVETGQHCSSKRGKNQRSSRVTGGSTASVGAVHQSNEVQTPTAAPSLNCEARSFPSPRGASPAVTTVPVHRGIAQGKMVLVASGLSTAELSVLKKFSKKTGSRLSPQVTPETTHIIIKTDEDLVCERTLKYFLGIAARKWVVSFRWIVQSFNQGKILNEVEFEVQGDVVNGRHHQGPSKARTTQDQKLLMRGYEVCFLGFFTDMTTGQMEWMVELCGAQVVKDPLLFTGRQKSTQLVVVQPGFEESVTGYKALQKKATVVSRGWLLDTVATYTLQNTDEYRV
ncbi:hypothetical protein JZ751_026453 [Albula glossodonta]|uniref:RING-type E3 ubiquitin transferase BRCA1 n=1 Tax=Albula glossodonta TaxID=121402 RepID=A0A8T2PDH3_9TELE|nr:hypothetical protein JZ751_026453 [Albula glossodonta]